MYRWYQASTVCYAYLSDVLVSHGANPLDKQIYSSLWFTRGWTLQELLAPKSLIFYNQERKKIGTEAEMTALLTSCTDIDQEVLHGFSPVTARSIAERMSWASKRITSRKEDTAYCLMGIFDVNMSMLYGEGIQKAFHRLQAQIISQSHDHTIYTWPIHHGDLLPGLLAHDPAAFACCGD